MASPSKSPLENIGPGFYNIRGHFNIIAGLIDIGTQMSLIQLPNNKYLIIDTVPLNPFLKQALDEITKNGTEIEAVIATHPFHTLAFRGFYKEYPQVPYYGCPRHLRVIPEIPWAGNLLECDVRNKWSPAVEMRIPAGSEFVAPMPEDKNHFSGVFVYHQLSKTIHNDDTIMVGSHPGILLKLAGFRHGSMSFHPSIKGVGLLPTPEAPYQFKEFIEGIIRDWDFDNICAAHMGNKIGGAKEQLREVLAKAEPLFKKLSEKNKKNPHAPPPDTPRVLAEGNECG
eukprot:Phypoly_transcript_15060.p1 GENE.Phypoly_transcript_15060~~Phypoly_transcript_15060.p1  ORF type:complete len:314 (+),score=53.43 Phypoly_transcript_15060:91-942(+)